MRLEIAAATTLGHNHEQAFTAVDIAQRGQKSIARQTRALAKR
jgi:hypothetical protein